MNHILASVLLAALPLSAAAQPPSASAFAGRGPHSVGYRSIAHWDFARSTAPARDYRGRSHIGTRDTPVQIGVWYPAGPGGTPVRFGEYHATALKSGTLESYSEADVAAAAMPLQRSARSLGIELSARAADSIVMAHSIAMRDAPPASGPFPLIVGGLGGIGTAPGLAEYLASHGYVVVSASAFETGSLQSTKPQVALETHTRNLELIYGMARTWPYVDAGRLGLLGIGFDGMAVLNHQMRNMSAAAVVSIEGWESSGNNILPRSPFYDPLRMRVPYLSYSQDNPPRPVYGFSDSLLLALKYADRHAYVVKGLEHGQLTSNPSIYPGLAPERLEANDFVWRTTRTFLDAHVKGDSVSRAWLERPSTANGYRNDLLKIERRHAALPAVPVTSEVDAIAASGNVAELRDIYKRASDNDAALILFTPRTLDTFAFRFSQQGRHDVAIAFQELSVEAFPRSTAAASNLANVYRGVGDTTRAVAQFERALELLDADGDVPTVDKDRWRRVIRQSLESLRPRRQLRSSTPPPRTSSATHHRHHPQLPHRGS